MIYIAGKISGTTDYAERFNAAEAALQAEGNTVINPARALAALPELGWESCMKVCLSLLSLCDTVFLLEGWEMSRGAKVEKYHAELHGYDVIRQTDWIREQGGRND